MNLLPSEENNNPLLIIVFTEKTLFLKLDWLKICHSSSSLVSSYEFVKSTFAEDCAGFRCYNIKKTAGK